MVAQIKVRRLGEWQFEITQVVENNIYYEWFQSYDVLVGKKTYVSGVLTDTYLDPTYWDYSKTTGKYRNIFLGEKKKETQLKIDSDEYKLENLN